MKRNTVLQVVLPFFRTVGTALALACASHGSVAGIVNASLGGFGSRALATVTGGGILNFFDPFGAYSTSASNGATTESQSLMPLNWNSIEITSQADPGGNLAQAGNTNGFSGSDNPPFLMVDSTGVRANVSTSTTPMLGLGPTTQAYASAYKEGLFNLVDPNTLKPVAGTIDFSFDYSLQVSAMDELDSVTSNVLLNIRTLSDPGRTFFEELITPGIREGNFSYSLDFGTGDTGYFAMSVQAQAVSQIGVSQIPEPAMLYLVGTALAGLVLVGRRRDTADVSASA